MLKIISVHFDYGESKTFKTLHDVLIYSIKKNIHQKIEIISHYLSEPTIRDRSRSFVSNTIKLEKWVKEINKCNNGDLITLLDCDMLVLNDFTDIFKSEFDIAYTIRTQSKWPLNGGVLFLKVNKRSRKFMNRFLEINNKMFKDQKFHRYWQNKYAGINQAAFGYMLEKESENIKLLDLPCAIYNACGEDLFEFDSKKVKILHIKGQLRKAVMGEGIAEHELLYPAMEWKKYYSGTIEESKSSGFAPSL